MPRELKKRGRREDKKRKAQDELSNDAGKKQRIDQTEEGQPLDIESFGKAGDDFISFKDDSYLSERPQDQIQFYGLLDDAEQTYYANVNAKLTADDFESEDDRALFIEAVHRETKGKEIKFASSQSCSRYLEKVIMLSLPDQLRSLFTAFLENLTYLVQHRFGSHCCEALFVRSANFVKAKRDTDDQDANLEDLFLSAAEQLNPNLGYLITDRFASHTIRVLLLILSGEEMDVSSSKLVASKRKETVDLPIQSEPKLDFKRIIPKSFMKARDGLITTAFAGLDTNYVRALATHPTGNPFLQLVLRLELAMYGKPQENANLLLFPNLFPDAEFQSGSETGKFIQGLIYDPSGSHLIETLVQYLPGKLFKRLYRNILKERMSNLVKNDIASYVAMRVLERLGKDDLSEVQSLIMPEIPGLLHRSRLGLVRRMFERFTIRQVDSTPLVTTIRSTFKSDNAGLIPKVLQLGANTNGRNSQKRNSEAESGDFDLHGSLLLQAMLADPTACKVIEEGFLAQPISDLLIMANTNIASRVIQAALIPRPSNIQFRKQFVPKFYGHIAQLAQMTAGSHVVDAFWNATEGAHFMKERIARELSQHESILRDSQYGRTVWRNWSMDVYQRRPGAWNALAKSGTGSPRELQNATTENDQQERPQAKSAIQLARERHAKSKGQHKGLEKSRHDSVTASA